MKRPCILHGVKFNVYIINSYSKASTQTNSSAIRGLRCNLTGLNKTIIGNVT